MVVRQPSIPADRQSDLVHIYKFVSFLHSESVKKEYTLKLHGMQFCASSVLFLLCVSIVLHVPFVFQIPYLCTYVEVTVSRELSCASKELGLYTLLNENPLELSRFEWVFMHCMLSVVSVSNALK